MKDVMSTGILLAAGFLGVVAVCGCQSRNPADLLRRGADLVDALPGVKPADATSPTGTVETSAGEIVADAELDGFLWEPRGDSVRIVIPGSLPHWQIHLVTLSTHHYIYGPDRSGQGRSGDVEYILPGSGADWAAIAAAECPKGYPSLMVYINTDQVQETGHRSAGWRVMDPAQRVVGSASTRLQPGQNK